MHVPLPRFPYISMASKLTHTAFLRLHDTETRRRRVLELYHGGGLSLAQIGAHPDVQRSKATVQSIVKVFKNRNTMETAPKSDRPSVLTPGTF